MKQNRLSEVINANGGIIAFNRKMGWRSDDSTRLREIVSGKRVPSERTRERIIRAAEGAISHEEIIEISGRSKPVFASEHRVDARWEADEDERRQWIAARAAAAARTQRLANERAAS